MIKQNFEKCRLDLIFSVSIPTNTMETRRPISPWLFSQLNTADPTIFNRTNSERRKPKALGHYTDYVAEIINLSEPELHEYICKVCEHEEGPLNQLKEHVNRCLYDSLKNAYPDYYIDWMPGNWMVLRPRPPRPELRNIFMQLNRTHRTGYTNRTSQAVHHLATVRMDPQPSTSQPHPQVGVAKMSTGGARQQRT